MELNKITQNYCLLKTNAEMAEIVKDNKQWKCEVVGGDEGGKGLVSMVLKLGKIKS